MKNLTRWQWLAILFGSLLAVESVWLAWPVIQSAVLGQESRNSLAYAP